MAVGGFSSYGQIMANRPQNGFGSFRDGMNTGQDMRDFFRKQNLRDELGNAESGIYANNPELDPGVAQEASAFARVGDFASAQAVLDRDRKAKEHALNMQMRADAQAERAENNRFNQQLRRDALNAQAQQKNQAAELKQAERDRPILESVRTLEAVRNRNIVNAQNFDERYKNIDDFRGQGTAGRFSNPGEKSFWNWGVSKDEREARNNFVNDRDALINSVYQSLKGAGAITDTELSTMAGGAKNASNPYELQQRIDSDLELIRSRNPQLFGGGYSTGNFVPSQGTSIDELDRIAMGQ